MTFSMASFHLLFISLCFFFYQDFVIFLFLSSSLFLFLFLFFTAAVRDNMLNAILDYTLRPRTEWMQRWAAQCVLNGSQTQWTREVEEFLKSKGNEGAHIYYEQLKRQLSDMVILIRGKISKAARITVGALAVVDVHARDVQKKMAESGVAHVTDFDWISQMRYVRHKSFFRSFLLFGCCQLMLS